MSSFCRITKRPPYQRETGTTDVLDVPADRWNKRREPLKALAQEPQGFLEHLQAFFEAFLAAFFFVAFLATFFFAAFFTVFLAAFLAAFFVAFFGIITLLEIEG